MIYIAPKSCRRIRARKDGRTTSSPTSREFQRPNSRTDQPTTGTRCSSEIAIDVAAQVWAIDQSLTVAGPHLRNNLLLHLRESELNFLEFRSLLKARLFC